MENHQYVAHYNKYLSYSRLIKIIGNRKLVHEIMGRPRFFAPLKVLDFACGGGQRMVEFGQYFLDRFNVLYLGYDPNHAWEEHWKRVLASWHRKHKWFVEAPKNFDGDIIHCSHAMYSEEVREQLFGLWEKSPTCRVLVVRGIHNASFFNELAREWELELVYNWEKYLQEYINNHKLNATKAVALTKAMVPLFMVEEYAEWLTTLVEFSGPTDTALDIILQFKDENIIKLPNSDVIYFISRP